MRTVSRGFVLTIGLLALGACSSDSSTEPEQEPEVEADPPEVATMDRATIPDYPEELELSVSCYTGPDGEFSQECPVLIWGDYTYWALSHQDNRFGMTVLAFDAEGEFVESWERSGARYLWEIEVDETAETVTFRGQDTGEFAMTWEELEL